MGWNKEVLVQVAVSVFAYVLTDIFIVSVWCPDCAKECHNRSLVEYDTLFVVLCYCNCVKIG